MDASPQLGNDGKPVGRFLQKWYVVANHQDQFWVSPSNEELKQKEEEFLKQHPDQQTEALNWIVFDTRQDRIVNELRMRNRGERSDVKEMKLQMSVSPSGPWTDVMDADMQSHNDRQYIGGFYAKARFWRVCFLSNYGEDHPKAPRYVMYEVQFWGPLDEEVENKHFVLE
jgi:hypothetical protein